MLQVNTQQQQNIPFAVHLNKLWYDILTANFFLYIQTGYAVIVAEIWLCISNEEE